MRGSNLALVHSTQDYGDWTNTVLVLGELGADGLFARGAWFDADAVDDAIELLDAWYVEGEGAEHAQVVTATAAPNRDDTLYGSGGNDLYTLFAYLLSRRNMA